MEGVDVVDGDEGFRAGFWVAKSLRQFRRPWGFENAEKNHRRARRGEMGVEIRRSGRAGWTGLATLLALARDFCARFTGFAQGDGDGLFAAFDFPGLAFFAGLQRTVFVLMHYLLDLAAAFGGRGFLSCWHALLECNRPALGGFQT